MRHSNLVNKYNRAKRHFEKGNFRRAKLLFESIIYEIESSDTESMGDINLHNLSEQYINEIKKKDLSNRKVFWITLVLFIIVLAIYLIFSH
jgi:ABC-type uncharacterized transport system fused permease/ATPase subunit